MALCVRRFAVTTVCPVCKNLLHPARPDFRYTASSRPALSRTPIQASRAMSQNGVEAVAQTSESSMIPLEPAPAVERSVRSEPRSEAPAVRYGYFDDSRREYVITTPKTPYPWINYLGCEQF